MISGKMDRSYLRKMWCKYKKRTKPSWNERVPRVFRLCVLLMMCCDIIVLVPFAVTPDAPNYRYNELQREDVATYEVEYTYTLVNLNSYPATFYTYNYVFSNQSNLSYQQSKLLNYIMEGGKVNETEWSTDIYGNTIFEIGVYLAVGEQFRITYTYELTLFDIRIVNYNKER
jgi:hypothetical protein